MVLAISIFILSPLIDRGTQPPFTIPLAPSLHISPTRLQWQHQNTNHNYLHHHLFVYFTHPGYSVSKSPHTHTSIITPNIQFIFIPRKPFPNLTDDKTNPIFPLTYFNTTNSKFRDPKSEFIKENPNSRID